MNTHRFSKSVAACALFSLALSIKAASPVAITVQAGQTTHRISPTLYGIFFEDINYAADGGLYAELVQNRSFEFAGRDALFAWSKVERGGAVARISVQDARPLNANNPHYLQLQVEKTVEGAGVANSGWGGIPVREDDKYLFSVYARVPSPSTASAAPRLTARIERADGESLGACEIRGLGGEWKHFTGTITPTGTDTNTRLVLLASPPVTVDLDMVSLFPEKTFKNRPNGLRADLAQMLADMKPAFMRFPGGCIVEGKDLANRYAWKDTIGDVAVRKANWNRWQDAVDIKAPQYYQSYGLGFFEFFQLCEDIGCEPLPILNCGMSCQYQDKQLVPLDQLDPFVQDALDLIEFANGPASSAWGAKRAAMGHPAPFNLKFLGVGNEQWGPTYFERYPVFHKAIKAKHPGIQIVSSAGPSESGEWFDYAWPRLRELKADIVDEHYYMPPQWFLKNAQRYDNYDRKGPKVFAGEYAAHTAGWGGNNRNNLSAALAEAAFMTGLERNSDVVVMASYAPLFAKIGNVQWGVDLIWYDNTQVYGTPSYYVQKLFSLNQGDAVLPTQIADNRPPVPPGGRIGVCTYHTDAEFKDIRVSRSGLSLYSSDFIKEARGWRPSGGRWFVSQGAYRQADTKAVASSLIGSPDWADYTLTLKARKLGGDEGFIIIVRNSGNDQVQWNLGGWGNKQHGIQDMAGGKEKILERVPGSIETNRWYDIKIALKGSRLECFLDGKLVQSADVPTATAPRLFATASKDSKTGQLILKVVNPTGENTAADLKVAGAANLAPEGQSIVLTSASATDENSMLEPTKVAPVTQKLTGVKSDFTHTFPANSLTILRLSATP